MASAGVTASVGVSVASLMFTGPCSIPAARSLGSRVYPSARGGTSRVTSDGAPEGRGSVLGQIEPGRLQLREAVERGEALVAAEPRLLESAERDRDVGGVERVYPDGAGPDRSGQAVGLLHVTGPDPGRQPVRRVVRDPDGLGLVLELDHGEDRAEDLLTGDPPAVGDAVEDRRRDVEAAGLLAHPLAAGRDAGALLAAERHVVEDLRQLALVDDGAEPRLRVEWLAGREPRSQLGDACHELLADRPMDDEPRARVAGLAAGVEDPPPDRARRRLEITDIGEDDLRALPAELQGDRLDIALAHGAEQRLADLSRAGERDLVDAGMAGQRVADDGARPGHDVEHAVRQACLRGELRQAEGREWRLRRGLQDDGGARRERRAELPSGDDQGVVPGNDQAGDADRLAGDERERVRPRGPDLPVDLVDRLGIPLDRDRRRGCVDVDGVADRL